MKIKALKTFVSGCYDASRGEVLEVPADVGHKLITLGFAEIKNDKGWFKAPAADKVLTPTSKKEGTGKSGAKTSTKK